MFVKNGRTYGRDPNSGPFIAADKKDAFIKWCNAHQLETRASRSFSQEGFDVRYNGHWMCVLWNKTAQRYNADRRLQSVIDMWDRTQSPT